MHFHINIVDENAFFVVWQKNKPPAKPVVMICKN